MTDAGEVLYTVAVRTLCEFTARSGDLDLRFSPTPSAQEGMARHALVASRRPAGYRTELPLGGRHQGLLVRGRADGFDPARRQLEEVKTFRGDFERITEAQRRLHWAQLKVYGALLCAQDSLEGLTLALVYLQLDTQQETVLTQSCTADDLQQFFVQQCEAFMAWAQQEAMHRSARQQALQALPFLHAQFRPGQRELAEAVWRAATQERPLMVEAPTGIGKTLGTLYPALKAMAAQGRPALDKLFFLTAKSSGRGLALGALDAMTATTGAPARVFPLRVLELVARDKACEHPDKACHGESCPLAQGFYDKLPAARAAAVQRPALDKPAVRTLALAHGVCPYYLAQDLLRWADVVVGDYNYYFDPYALLYAMTRAQEWRVALLVDEAHNLVERARQMWSAELDEAALSLARRDAPAPVKKELDTLKRRFKELAQDRPAYSVLDALPAKFRLAMQQAASRIAAWQAEHPTEVHADLQRFFFDLLAFMEREEALGAHSFLDLTLRERTGRTRALLSLRNVVPAPFLKPRLQAAATSVLFSATLQPQDFYLDLLGLPEATVVMQVPAPFAAAQLRVAVMRGISTRWQDRRASLPDLVALMAQQWGQEPGKYLAFFSSFDYLQQAADALAQAHPQLPQWRQTPRMDEASQEAFLERFRTGAPGIGFAVLGGSFAEGVDLPGSQLIGAFIATLGLPQVNPVNEEMSRRMQALFGRGQDYAYLYPGLRKVAQAAGRVIRRPEDHGVVYLMDGRFARPEVRALLPGWWRPQVS